MGMPKHLVLVRHGESEANVLQGASKKGDDRLYTEELMTLPDRAWRLTAKGVAQATQAGSFLKDRGLVNWDRMMVSPYIRTRETALNLSVSNARWEENRSIRERSWGEISSIPRSQFEKSYSRNAQLKKSDPLYWAPPAGESISDVAENRVRNVLSTLHRECENQSVLMVTHGEFIWSMMLTIERWNDEEFIERDSDPQQRIHNCSVVHYTREDPVTKELADKLQWVQRTWPVMTDSGVEIITTEWREFHRPYYSNEELAKRLNGFPNHFK